MTKPAGLGPEGSAAYDAAAAAVGERLEREHAAVVRYARAVEVAAAIYRRWEQARRPVTGHGSQKQTVAHPLLRAMHDAEEAAARAGAALGLDEQSASKILTHGVGSPRRGSHLVAAQSPSRSLRSA